MNKQKSNLVKYNPPAGVLPALQYLLPQQLNIDESYQRSIDSGDSQALIAKIARCWNWDLCQPLVVARRDNGELYVIDGQHRLAAARLRGDIAQLPAVVVNYASAADEAAGFVHLNQQRRPLTPLQIFHAAIVSGDKEASAVLAAIEAAGLKLGKHANLQLGKPMTIIKIGGILSAWRRQGAKVTSEALQVLSAAFAGERLLYAGTIFPGIVRVCAGERRGRDPFAPARFARFTAMLGSKGQLHWRSAMMAARAADPNLNYSDASAKAIGDAWAAHIAGPAPETASPKPNLPKPAPGNREWCNQCDGLVTRSEAEQCKSRHCSSKRDRPPR